MFKMACAAALFLSATAAIAQAPEKISDGVVKIGLILDMTSMYADVTGPGSAEAAKMAVEDFGKQVLGKPIEILVADQQNKADVAAARAREWLDNEKVYALLEVVDFPPALAAMDIAKTKNKIIVLNGPGAVRITNEACTPVSFHWAFSTRSP